MHQHPQATISTKIASFRKQIRRKEINQFIVSKRKVLLKSFLSLETLQSLFSTLKSNPKHFQALQTLCHLSAEQQMFFHFDGFKKKPQQKVIDHFCCNAVDIVCNKVFKCFNDDSQRSNKGRILCLNFILNLVADVDVCNQLLVKKISTFLYEEYRSVEVWGQDEETIQIGWLIGNLFKKQICNSQNKKEIEYLLEWVQQLTLLKNPQMLSSLYSGLCTFTLITRHSYPQRQNILQKTILSNLSHTSPSTMHPILHYLAQQIPLLLLLSKEINQATINNLMVIFNCKDRTQFHKICVVLKKMMCYQGMDVQMDVQEDYQKELFLEMMAKNRVHFLKYYFDKLNLYLMTFELSMKYNILTFLTHLVHELPSKTYNDSEAIDFMVSHNLENTLASLVRNCTKDQELIILCFQIIEKVIVLSNLKHGHKFVAEVENIQELGMLVDKLGRKEEPLKEL